MYLFTTKVVMMRVVNKVEDVVEIIRAKEAVKGLKIEIRKLWMGAYLWVEVDRGLNYSCL